jgi:hypothetical protein
MRMRRRMWQGPRRSEWGQRPVAGVQGRGQVEVQQQRLRHRLDRLAQQQARLQGWLEVLEQQTPARGTAGMRGTDRGEGSEYEETDEGRQLLFSGRVPPHGASVGDVDGMGETVLREALFEIFDELVDPDDPTIPRVVDMNTRLKERGVKAIRRMDAESVYEEWLGSGS